MKILSYTKGVICTFLLLISHSVFADWSDVSSDIEITKSRPAFDRVNRVYFVHLDLKNTGASPLSGPFRVLVDNSTIPVTRQSGNTEAGIPFVDLTNESITANESVRVRVDFLAQRKALTFDAMLQVNELKLTGVFLDSAVEGVRYETSSGIEGFTNSLGEYNYNEGDTVKFFIGDVILGEALAESILTLDEFSFSREVAQFLQTLDEDSISENGIKISADLHNTPLLKKSSTNTDSIHFKDTLNIKDFYLSKENTEFITNLGDELGLQRLIITSPEAALSHYHKSVKLKVLQEAKPELYAFIIGDYGRYSNNIPWRGNLSDNVESRVAYYFYTHVFKDVLESQKALHLDLAEEAEVSQSRIEKFSDDYLSIGALTSEFVMFSTAQYLNDESEYTDYQVYQAIKYNKQYVDAITSSGKSSLLDYTSDLTGSQFLEDSLKVADTCLPGVPDWPIPSINELSTKIFGFYLKETLKYAGENALKAVDCAANQIPKITGAVINVSKGSFDLSNFYAYQIAEKYLDVYFSCGKNTQYSCMASFFGGEGYMESQVAHIANQNLDGEFNLLEIAIQVEAREKAKLIIKENLQQINELANIVSNELPSNINNEVNRTVSHLKVDIKPIGIAQNENNGTDIWLSLDVDNLYNQGIKIYGMKATLEQNGEEVDIHRDAYADIQNKIESRNFLANRSSKNIIVRYALKANSLLSEGGLAQLIFEIPYHTADRVVTDVVQYVINLDVSVLADISQLEEHKSLALTLSKNIDTIDEGEIYYLPDVLLGDSFHLLEDGLRWMFKSSTSGELNVLKSFDIDEYGNYYVELNNLPQGFSSELFTFTAYSNFSPLSQPVIFALNIAKKPVEGELSITLPDGDPGDLWVDLPAYGSWVSSYLGVDAFANYSNFTGEFQCTELVKRFYSQIFGIDKSKTGHGRNVAHNYGGEEGVYNNQAILVDYNENELSKRLPSNGSIVSISGGPNDFGDANGPYGHVAIVKKVERINDNKYEVTLFEQNWIWAAGEKISHSRVIEFTRDDKGYWSSTVDATKGRYVIGWTTLRLAGENQPPIANAGEDLFVPVGEQASLDASLSTDDGIIETYEWLENDIVAAIAQSFSTPNLSVGIHEFTLRVTDNFGEQDTDTINVVVYDSQSDADHDGMPDVWEITNGLDPLVDDSLLGDDGDNRNNLQEYLDGTDPNTYDEYNPTPDIERGLVAYYPFDGDANDYSVYDNNGDPEGGVAYVDGVRRLSASFDGVDDYFLVANSDSFPTQEISLSYWIKMDELPSYLYNYVSKEHAFQSYFTNNNVFQSGLWKGVPGHWSGYESNEIDMLSAQWLHYTFTFSNITKEAKTYINGELVNNIIEQDPSSILISSNQDLYIGRNGSASTHFIKGELDELRIYNRAITSDEVSELYTRDASSEQPENKVTDLNGNHKHWCAIANNEVTCWGEVYKYKEDEFLSTFVNPKQVSHGRNHACVLDDRGVECWGWDYYGVLDVPTLSNPTYLSSGEQHVCAIDDTGVVCWGKNNYGQIDVPANLINPKQVSAGELNTCALDDTGVVCWGWDHIVNLQVDDITNPEQVRLSNGAARICVSDSSNLSCWGSEPPAAFPEFNDITHIGQYDYAGYCAIDNNEAVCWDTLGVYKPQVSNPTVASYTDGTYCVGDDEGVRCWGRDDYGKLEVPEKLIFKNEDLISESSSFNMVWRVDAGQKITIPIRYDYAYNYQVDWGDNSQITSETTIAQHTYQNAGEYTVKVTGTFPAISCNYSQCLSLIDITQWGSNSWATMESAFKHSININITASDAPDLRLVTNMSNMFDTAASFNGDINHWDVSNVISMQSLFYGARSFNRDLSNWDVSSVTDMAVMFRYTLAFNGDISNWDVSNVTNMLGMFIDSSFNGDISNWDVSSVTDMTLMFGGAAFFNSDISNWDVSSVINMNYMLWKSKTFNRDLSRWDVANVTSMQAMFELAETFNSNLSEWDVSRVIDMSRMFNGAKNFNGDLSSWNVSSVSSRQDFSTSSQILSEPVWP